LKDIEKWEEKVQNDLEEKKLEIIKLETKYDKCYREIKNKDNYGDGLHLIDFEKLKIEN